MAKADQVPSTLMFLDSKWLDMKSFRCRGSVFPVDDLKLHPVLHGLHDGSQELAPRRDFLDSDSPAQTFLAKGQQIIDSECVDEPADTLVLVKGLVAIVDGIAVGPAVALDVYSEYVQDSDPVVVESPP